MVRTNLRIIMLLLWPRGREVYDLVGAWWQFPDVSSGEGSTAAGALRDADEPAVIERLRDVNDVAWKQREFVVVTRTVRLNRTVPIHTHSFGHSHGEMSPNRVSRSEQKTSRRVFAEYNAMALWQSALVSGLNSGTVIIAAFLCSVFEPCSPCSNASYIAAN